MCKLRRCEQGEGGLTTAFSCFLALLSQAKQESITNNPEVIKCYSVMCGDPAQSPTAYIYAHLGSLQPCIRLEKSSLRQLDSSFLNANFIRTRYPSSGAKNMRASDLKRGIFAESHFPQNFQTVS